MSLDCEPIVRRRVAHFGSGTPDKDTKRQRTVDCKRLLENTGSARVSKVAVSLDGEKAEIFSTVPGSR